MSLTEVALEVVDVKEGRRREAVTLPGAAVVVAREVALIRAVFVAARLPNLTFFAIVASRLATR